MKATLVLAAVLINILGTGLTCSGTPPAFSKLRVVSGEVESLKQDTIDGDYSNRYQVTWTTDLILVLEAT